MSATGASVTFVRPASARLETLAILSVVAILIAATIALARANAREDEQVREAGSRQPVERDHA